MGRGLIRIGVVAGVTALSLLAGMLPVAAAAAVSDGGGGGEFRRSNVAVGSIATGRNHTCALLGGGTVKCWGEGLFGQLGYGDRANRGDGRREMGNRLPFVRLGRGRTARAIAAGDAHTCAVLDNGRVKCWGNGLRGKLGYGDERSRGDDPGEMGNRLPFVRLGRGRTARAIAAGDAHTCALLDNGRVKCWGANRTGDSVIGGRGMLGYGHTFHRGDGAGQMGDNLPFVDLGAGRRARAISASGFHTCALLDNGGVKCWGTNRTGTLGYGDTLDRGYTGLQMGDNLPFVDLGGGRTARAIAAGASHTCALLDNGGVKCWGGNASGQLGYGDEHRRGDNAGEMGDNLSFIDLGIGRTATAISAGVEHTCALLDNGGVKCWGWNSFGQLGYGDRRDRGDEPGEMGERLPFVNLGRGLTARAITASRTRTCAVLENGRVKCWGWNEVGQLGYGDTRNRGDRPGTMGVRLRFVDLGSGRSRKGPHG